MAQKGFISSMMGGSYVAGNSILHQMNVGTKLTATLILVTVVGVSGWAGLAGVAAVGSIALFAADYSLRIFLRRMKTFIWFLLVVALFPALFTPGTPIAALHAAPVTVTWEGLSQAGLSSCRLLLMFLLSSVLIHTTPILEMVRQAENLRSRFPRFGAPLKEVIAVAALAFQMMPLLCVHAEQWVTDHLHKENKTMTGGLISKARQAAGLLGPWIASVLGNAERFAGDLGKQEDSISSHPAENPENSFEG